jgi:hypothetical protein
VAVVARVVPQAVLLEVVVLAAAQAALMLATLAAQEHLGKEIRVAIPLYLIMALLAAAAQAP